MVTHMRWFSFTPVKPQVVVKWNMTGRQTGRQTGNWSPIRASRSDRCNDSVYLYMSKKKFLLTK